MSGYAAATAPTPSPRKSEPAHPSAPGVCARARIRTAFSREFEAALLLEARQARGDARARLIRSFMPLIGGMARTYRHVPGVHRSELMQEGVVGVLRALERFNPDLGTPFWAYASWWVRQAMQQVVSELSRPVVLSDRALRQLARLRDARRTFVRVHSREPSLPELATHSELTMVQVQRLLVAERQPRSLEEPIDETRWAGATFGDLLCDPGAEEAFDELATRLDAAEVPRLLGCLSGRERTVVEARYGIRGPQRTLRELGQTMGVSAERVRQIEQAALEKMRLGEADRHGPHGSVPQQRVARPGTGELRASQRPRLASVLCS